MNQLNRNRVLQSKSVECSYRLTLPANEIHVGKLIFQIESCTFTSQFFLPEFSTLEN